jgi:hypothetical protein
MVKLFARSCVVLPWGAISSSPRLPVFGVHFSAARPVWNLTSGEVCATIFLDQRRAFEWRIKSPGRPVEGYHGPWVSVVA